MEQFAKRIDNRPQVEGAGEPSLGRRAMLWGVLAATIGLAAPGCSLMSPQEEPHEPRNVREYLRQPKVKR